jgi:two-component system response regulator YesN
MPLVLIVDDCAGTCDAFSGILRLEGFDTATAGNGAAGLTYASQHEFDVGLIDLQLPDMSGVEVIKEMRARGTRSPLIIVTAFPAIDSCFDAASVGASGYVDGPLLGDEIAMVVRQALAGVHPVRHPARLAESACKTAAKSFDATRSASHERILQVVRIIEAELPTERSIDALARRVGISSSRLRHQFTSFVGLPLSRFILDRRLQKAARMLVTTGEDVQTVAGRVGMARDLRRFRRAFRDKFGMSPSAYRAAFSSGGPKPRTERTGRIGSFDIQHV